MICDIVALIFEIAVLTSGTTSPLTFVRLEIVKNAQKGYFYSKTGPIIFILFFNQPCYNHATRIWFVTIRFGHSLHPFIWFRRITTACSMIWRISARWDNFGFFSRITVRLPVVCAFISYAGITGSPHIFDLLLTCVDTLIMVNFFWVI